MVSQKSEAVGMADYETLIAFQPWRAEIYERMADKFVAEEQYLDAISVYQVIVGDGSISLDGVKNYGHALIQTGETRQALQLWLKYQESHPESSDLYENIYHLQLDQGDISGVTQTLRAWGKTSGDPQVLFLLAQSLSVQDAADTLEVLDAIDFQNTAFEPRVDRLRDAVQQGLNNEDQAYYYSLVGQALAANGCWEFARFAFEQSIAHNPDYAEAWALLGEAREQTGVNGLPDLQRAIVIDPDSIVARALLGLYLRNHGDLDQSLTNYRYLAIAQPENPTWQLELGNTYLASGEIVKSLDHFQSAITLDPHDPKAWKALARVCADYGVDVRDTALPAARQALYLDPDDPNAHILLGQIMESLGDSLSAERAFLSALRLDGNNLQAHYYLGIHYLDMGVRDKAFYHLSLATQPGMIYPEKDLATRYIDLYFNN
ncbi:MAG: tetratricopeptide repeat protein [Anaerolineae bacterium]|nr:tetratricopeptide repeat protein [Anaerolineae bacterium]